MQNHLLFSQGKRIRKSSLQNLQEDSESDESVGIPLRKLRKSRISVVADVEASASSVKRRKVIAQTSGGNLVRDFYESDDDSDENPDEDELLMPVHVNNHYISNDSDDSDDDLSDSPDSGIIGNSEWNQYEPANLTALKITRDTPRTNYPIFGPNNCGSLVVGENHTELFFFSNLLIDVWLRDFGMLQMLMLPMCYANVGPRSHMLI